MAPLMPLLPVIYASYNLRFALHIVALSDIVA